jgi:hypothetical protein
VLLPPHPELPPPRPELPPHLRGLLTGAALVQGIEAAAVLFASVLVGADAASGRSYHVNSGIALTLIGVATALALGYVAWGIARTKPWSRTPALISQVLCGFTSLNLLESHRYAWGVPGLLLTVAGLTTLLIPASFRALAGGLEAQRER